MPWNTHELATELATPSRTRHDPFTNSPHHHELAMIHSRTRHVIANSPRPPSRTRHVIANSPRPPSRTRLDCTNLPCQWLQYWQHATPRITSGPEAPPKHALDIRKVTTTHSCLSAPHPVKALTIMKTTSQPSRKASTKLYYERNREKLIASAKVRVAMNRARKASESTPEEQASARQTSRASQAKYREANREALRQKEARRRQMRKLRELGFFDASENDDNYSEYEYSSEAESSTASDSEGDWECEEKDIPQTTISRTHAHGPGGYRQNPIWDLLKPRGKANTSLGDTR
ncbi:hypothetical protein CCMSSC00406_0008302 [Pleurotus cornucopiae]|uniref:Uncharacterized protein n=1 Tax=Pleurotus cornucopiae TaxID=5321 RepID=A0ACB7IT44_PLECO|nr:hypothetical protein CCMSSC00406_0008302 [Pleurotus cornucopiae]